MKYAPFLFSRLNHCLDLKTKRNLRPETPESPKNASKLEMTEELYAQRINKGFKPVSLITERKQLPTATLSFKPEEK